MRVEIRALEFAKNYYQYRGFAVKDVSRSRGHNGYDLLLSRDSELIKVEVKGCSREWQIPDLFSTEFDSNNKLVADYLCVIYLVADHEPMICEIPRDAIPPEFVIPKTVYRISSRFKKRETLEQFCSSLPTMDTN